jgi:hypothetical protein
LLFKCKLAARLIFAADTEDGVHFLELHVVLVGSLPVGAHGVWLLTCDVKKSGNEVIRVLVDIYEVCEAFRSQEKTTRRHKEKYQGEMLSEVPMKILSKIFEAKK